jgi:octaprenyl-diphosphate synthase
LKLSKDADAGRLRLDAALRALDGAAPELDAELRARLCEAQAALGDDLGRLEAALGAVTAAAPRPAAEAARHLIARGGKRVRPLAVLLSAACCGPIPPAARELAVVAELVHTATLLHDDVIDDGRERRGAPAARLLFGNAVSVLAGDLLLVHALARTLEHAPAVLPDLIATLRRLVEGEIVQLRGRSELDVSETTYERILLDKTASLFAWATRVGARVAGAPAEIEHSLARFGELLGMSFQLVDDVLDYSSERTGKTSLADLREGKLTLPLVLAVERRPELRDPVARIHAGDGAGELERVRAAVLECGACDEARRRAGQYTDLAVAALRGVEPGPARSLLEGVAWELAGRAA